MLQPSPAATSRTDEPPFRTGPLASLAWLHFVNDGASNFLPAILPVVLLRLGKSPALAGTLMFVLIAGQGLQPVTGLLGARIDGWNLMRLGVIGTALGAGLVGSASTFGALLLVLAGIGICNACFHPQALTTARTYAGNRSGLGMAVMMLGGEIGRGVWPLLAGAAVAWGSLRSLWIPAIIGVVSVPVVLRFLQRPPPQRESWRLQFRGRRKATLKLLAYASLRELVIIGVVTYLPILWDSRHKGLLGGAGIIALMLGTGIAGTMWGGHFADRLGRRAVMAGASALMAACLAILAWGHGPVLWIGAGLLGVPAYATFPATTLIGQDLFPENRPFGSGVALGLGNALGAGLLALLALGVGKLTIPGLLWVLAVIAAVCVPLALELSASPHQAQRS